MSEKKERVSAESSSWKPVGLITKKGYRIADASRNLGIESSMLRRWKKQLADDP